MEETGPFLAVCAKERCALCPTRPPLSVMSPEARERVRYPPAHVLDVEVRAEGRGHSARVYLDGRPLPGPGRGPGRWVPLTFRGRTAARAAARARAHVEGLRAEAERRVGDRAAAALMRERYQGVLAALNELPSPHE